MNNQELKLEFQINAEVKKAGETPMVNRVIRSKKLTPPEKLVMLRTINNKGIYNRKSMFADCGAGLLQKGIMKTKEGNIKLVEFVEYIREKFQNNQQK